MTDDESKPVAVSRRICASAHDIFQILANPVRHQEFDGSGMLRGAVSTTVISGAGDVFVMKMYYSALGDYEMNNHVVDYEPDRRRPPGSRSHGVRRSRAAAMTGRLCLGGDARTQVGAFTDLPHYPDGCDVEDVHCEALFVGQHERAGIHDAHPGRQSLVIGQL